MPLRLLFASLVTFLSVSCFKDPPPEEIKPVVITTRVLVNNLTLPWEILWGPDGFIWMSEKQGKISRVDPSSGEVFPLLTIDEVEVRGEGGLLGMAIPSTFTEDPYLFVAYNYVKAGQYTQKVVRYTVDNGSLTQPLIIHDDVRGGSIHNGCRIAISKDNKLFITTGDASDQSLPQNISSRNGKILRLNFDGSIPPDNPDPSSPVWSYGHRNSQGLVFVNDSLFSSEHGPDSDDEINMIHKGGNYGWPDVKGNCDAGEQDFCSTHHVIEPLMKWTPTIATCGLDYYHHNELPQWNNSLLLCTLKGSTLYQLQLDNSQRSITSVNTFFNGQFGRLRDVCISPEGKVFICTSNGNDDKIVEVKSER